MTDYMINLLEVKMQISYKKLWKLLIDRDMLKKDLATKAAISSTSVAKLSKNENVNTEILRKICTALDCDVSDIMEMVEEKI
jgi:DNA-binding Xre family transcriptional regulator